MLAGIANTVWVSIWGVILATLIGLRGGDRASVSQPFAGLPRVSLCGRLRNVPLLLYLFLWYALIVTSLPSVREAWEPLPHVFLSNSGLTVPALTWTTAHSLTLGALGLGIILATIVHPAGDGGAHCDRPAAAILALGAARPCGADHPGHHAVSAGSFDQFAGKGPFPDDWWRSIAA